MSKCLESLLESRLDFVLHQEARDMGLPEDAAIQVQPSQLEWNCLCLPQERLDSATHKTIAVRILLVYLFDFGCYRQQRGDREWISICSYPMKRFVPQSQLLQRQQERKRQSIRKREGVREQGRLSFWTG